MAHQTGQKTKTRIALNTGLNLVNFRAGLLREFAAGGGCEVMVEAFPFGQPILSPPDGAGFVFTTGES